MKESSIVNSIKRFLKTRPLCWFMKVHGAGYAINGVPDLLVVDDGFAAFFEVKRPGEKLTAIQASAHQKLKAAGMRVFVVNSASDVREILSHKETV